ncbi:hypothetical protein LCGC14_0305610 [marine sediment metagenome]|uniref:MgtC/SapB/SrpB/YhiD N-terminal domain-containing protein n=1 Tax=marine sediment metagenome TaxID=412755 RepID=A0A0F9U611_9ZZZZ
MISLIPYTKILLVLLLSAIIGFERERSHKEAGLRTVMLISLGTVTFTLVPFTLLDIAKTLPIIFDFSRILAYIIGGIGFLSGIVIIVKKNTVEGITTSACIFSTVAFSMMIGLGEYILGSFIALCTWIVLISKYYSIKKKRGKKNG